MKSQFIIKYIFFNIPPEDYLYAPFYHELKYLTQWKSFSSLNLIFDCIEIRLYHIVSWIIVLENTNYTVFLKIYL